MSGRRVMTLSPLFPCVLRLVANAGKQGTQGHESEESIWKLKGLSYLPSVIMRVRVRLNIFKFQSLLFLLLLWLLLLLSLLLL